MILIHQKMMKTITPKQNNNKFKLFATMQTAFNINVIFIIIMSYLNKGDKMDYKDIFLGFSCIFGIIILIFSLISKNKFKILLLNALSGVLILLIINITSEFTGVYLPINKYTVTYCTVFGTFGNVLFILLKFIFI